MASTSKKKKSDCVSFSTFKKWSFSGDFDVETVDNDIILLRCKICSDNFKNIRQEATRRKISGPPFAALVRYVDGITYVHKGNVEKHIKSGSLHQWAKEKFSKSASSTTPDTAGDATLKKSENVLQKFVATTSTNNYTHLFNTALSLVLSEKPFTDMPFAVNMQVRNGVSFMPGKDDHHSCAQFVEYLAKSMTEDISSIFASANFFSGEMDGSEARKTKEEKELIYGKVVIRGQPTELFLKCQRMSDFGGVDATSTKQAFDNTFLKEYKMSEDKFTNRMVCVCADGASVNMGRITGACTTMKATRPWLLIIHCVNHRLELAMGDAFLSNQTFKLLDEMLISIFYLFRNSGKNKRILARIAERLTVTHVSFVNSKGTRFQAYHYEAIRAMIVNFLPLLLFAENMIESDNRGCRPDLKAQLKGYHNKWVTYGFLSSLELYRQVLRLTAHVSFTMQRQGVLVTEIFDVLEQCKQGLREIAESETPLFPFSVQVNEETDTATVSGTNLPAKLQFRDRGQMSDRQKKVADKNITKVQEEFTLKKVMQGKQQVQNIKQTLIPAIVTSVDKRFKSLQDPMIEAMRIADPSTWDCEDPNFGKQELRTIADNYHVPLEGLNFNLDLALRELNGVKLLKATTFKAFKGKISFWERIFADYQQKYPHFLLIVELCLCVIFSSATVERGFSTVKRHLADTRLSLKNSTLNNLLLLRINTPILQKLDPGYERKLVQKAVKLYLDCPTLKRGRYHKTETQHSEDRVPIETHMASEDIFLPVSTADFIRPDNEVNELLRDESDTVGVLSDHEESDIDLCADETDSSESDDDILTTHEM